MKIKYLGKFTIEETHTMGENSPFEQFEHYMVNDKDNNISYPLDEICRTNTAWTGDLSPFDAVYQESYSQVLFKSIGDDTYRAWETRA